MTITALCPSRRRTASTAPAMTGPERDRHAPDRDHPARGAELRGRRLPVRWQKWSFRVGFTIARASSCTRSATPTAASSARSCTGPRSARWSCPTATRPTASSRAPSTSARPHRHAGQLADARLRLPRRDPLLRRASRRRRGTRSRSQRDLHARGGRRDALEALDFRTDDTEVRRARRLVVSFIATVGNYEYGFFWYLYQDGTIELEIKVTGIVATGAVAAGEQPELRHARRRRASTRRTTSTSSARGSTSTLDGERQPSPRSDTEAAPQAPATRRNGFYTAAHASAHRGRGAPRPSTRSRPRLARRQPGAHERARRIRSATASCPARTCRPSPRPTSRSASAPASSTSTSGSPRYDPDERYAGRRVPEPEPRRRRPAARGPRPTAIVDDRHRRLVHVGPPPRPAARGLAGDAGGTIGFTLKPAASSTATRRSTSRRPRSSHSCCHGSVSSQ